MTEPQPIDFSLDGSDRLDGVEIHEEFPSNHHVSHSDGSDETSKAVEAESASVSASATEQLAGFRSAFSTLGRLCPTRPKPLNATRTEKDHKNQLRPSRPSRPSKNQSVKRLEAAHSPAPDLDAFEERAAIVEFDGGLSRGDAERIAAQDQGHASRDELIFAASVALDGAVGAASDLKAESTVIEQRVVAPRAR